MQPSIGAPSAVTAPFFTGNCTNALHAKSLIMVVWAGSDRVVIGGVECASTPARVYTAGIVWRAGTHAL